MATPYTRIKYYYLYLVSDTNALTANTEYTYTVVASGSYKTIDKTEVKATPTDIPAKGTKLDPVSGVTLTLLPDADTISVSWTAGTVPSRYYVYVYRNDSQVDNTYTSLDETKASISWPTQTDGEYVASVYAYVPGNSPYFESSDYAVSAKQKYEALFGNSASAGNLQPITANGTITGYSVYQLWRRQTRSNGLRNGGQGLCIGYINFGDAKPGVSYSVEHATVDASGNAETYAER